MNFIPTKLEFTKSINQNIEGEEMKTWKFNDIYNFYSEFNRIEWYNEYCKRW